MKKIFILTTLFSVYLAFGQITEAGKWMGNNDLKNSPYELASNDYMKLTLESIEAYNKNDIEK